MIRNLEPGSDEQVALEEDLEAYQAEQKRKEEEKKKKRCV